MSNIKQFYHNEIEKKMRNNSKYQVVGIANPGLVNVLIDGKFRDIKLYEADDIILAKLAANGCPFVQLMPQGILNGNCTLKEIKIIPLKTTSLKIKRNK